MRSKMATAMTKAIMKDWPRNLEKRWMMGFSTVIVMQREIRFRLARAKAMRWNSGIAMDSGLNSRR
jgi:hypothetical protein